MTGVLTAGLTGFYMMKPLYSLPLCFLLLCFAPLRKEPISVLELTLKLSICASCPHPFTSILMQSQATSDPGIVSDFSCCFSDLGATCVTDHILRHSNNMQVTTCCLQLSLINRWLSAQFKKKKQDSHLEFAKMYHVCGKVVYPWKCSRSFNILSMKCRR